MKNHRLVISVLFLSIFLFVLAQDAFSENLKDEKWKRDYWLKKYGELKSDENWKVKRANQVFDRLLSVADKRKGVEPQLFVINHKSIPWAQSLADGSIILAENALSFCYAGNSKTRGDARLAFVLGHELAHQFNGDFWHFFFFNAADSGEEKDGLKEIKEIVKDPEVFKMRELQADQYGIIYASLAGFEIAPVVSKEKSFFDEWAGMIGGGSLSVRNSAYPSPKERAKTIRVRLHEVVKRLGFFETGVICYRLGWYDESLALFEEFAKYYPGREVYTNIGTVYLAKAVDAIRKGLWKRPFLFFLYFGAEPYTKAEAIEASVPIKLKENKEKETEKLVERAGYFLEKAVEGDHIYYLSKNNLGCIYILNGKYHEAIASFEDAMRLKPSEKGIVNNMGVAYFLLGEKLKNEGLKAQAKKEFEDILEAKPYNLQAKLNLSVIEGKIGAGSDLAMGITDFNIDDSLQLPNLPKVHIEIKPNLPISGDVYKKIGRVEKNEISYNKSGLVYIESEDKGIRILLQKSIVKLVVYKVTGIKGGGSDSRGVKVVPSEKKGVIYADGNIKGYFEYQ